MSQPEDITILANSRLQCLAIATVAPIPPPVAQHLRPDFRRPLTYLLFKRISPIGKFGEPGRGNRFAVDALTASFKSGTHNLPRIFGVESIKTSILNRLCDLSCTHGRLSRFKKLNSYLGDSFTFPSHFSGQVSASINASIRANSS